MGILSLFLCAVFSFSVFAKVYTNCGATVAYLSHTPEDDRIVVVGIGAITPVGKTAASTYQGVVAGQSGAGPITLFGASPLPVRIAAEVPAFDFGHPSQYGFLNRPGPMSRTHQLAVVASVEAAVQAGLISQNDKGEWEVHHEPEQLGAFIGSTQGESGGVEKAAVDLHKALGGGPAATAASLADGQLALKGIPSLAASHTAIALNAQGPILCPSSACASGSQAIALAGMMLPHTAQVMVAGGSDAQISPVGIVARHRLGVLSQRNDDPTKASRPWDKDRDGFVMGEGAAVMILTTERYAKEHGMKIQAYLAGAGMTSDAKRVTAPSPDGQARAMRIALQRAGLKPEQIGYIHAHGTSTSKGDVSELDAIKRALGAHAFVVPISSTKSQMGHLLGASGSVGSVVAIQAMNQSVVPPTSNLHEPSLKGVTGYGVNEEEMKRFNLVPLEAQPVDIEAVLVNSFGLGGQNVALIFVRPLR